jgi:hypothetical protein
MVLRLFALSLSLSLTHTHVHTLFLCAWVTQQRVQQDDKMHL